MTLPIHEMQVTDAICVACDVAREFGLKIGQPVPLRSTNNAVAWLQPANVVAKVSVGRNARLHTELEVVRELHARGGPVISPAAQLPAIVHRRGGLQMTFWQYHPQHSSAEAPPAEVALALRRLHAALAQLPTTVRERLPSYREELSDARCLLVDRRALPVITRADRDMLVTTYDRLSARLDAQVCVDRLVALHGAPHPYNLLLVGGAPVFIDFETTCMGPVEWDLAHLEPRAEPVFRDVTQAELLWLCRSMASVKTATFCVADIDRGDMREHAQWHLAHIRNHVAPRLR